MSSRLLEVRNLEMNFDVRRFFRKVGSVRALGGVSFELERAETLAVVGESGCGKTTLARCLLGIESPTNGEILLNGQNTSELKVADFRQQIQMIFQDPYGSLNPRKRIWELITEPLAISTRAPKTERFERALHLMERVGLRPELAARYPHMLSGGQRQRVGIARALILQPKILVCDEPVSALDVSIQAQILNLLRDLQEELGLAYLFISHDLSVVRHIADRVMVIYLGKTVEYGTREEVFSNPRHPYTQALLQSTPRISTRVPGVHRLSQIQRPLQGELPSAMNPPSGCSFHRRCPLATERCSTEVPLPRMLGSAAVACHFATA